MRNLVKFSYLKITYFIIQHPVCYGRRLNLSSGKGKFQLFLSP